MHILALSAKEFLKKWYQTGSKKQFSSISKVGSGDGARKLQRAILRHFLLQLGKLRQEDFREQFQRFSGSA
jgi:hypothetical protein